MSPLNMAHDSFKMVLYVLYVPLKFALAVYFTRSSQTVLIVMALKPALGHSNDPGHAENDPELVLVSPFPENIFRSKVHSGAESPIEGLNVDKGEPVSQVQSMALPDLTKLLSDIPI